LPTAADAAFNAYRRQHDPTCLPDTRVDLLQEIYKWADGPDERCIFWLNGLAGTGKSTIARTVARRHFDQGRLGASFFFSRGGGDVSHARKFFSTLAVQLAHNIPSLGQYIREAVTKCKDVTNQSLSDQWRQLVLSPLSNLESDSCQPYILVVDALDECENEDDIRTILRLFAEVGLLETDRLRIFLTSRPEILIQRGFQRMLEARHQDFVLHNISPPLVDHDIAIFLKDNLRQIRKELGREAGWPGDEVVENLVRSASGLFIWASTACRFIRGGRRFAADRLSVLLKDRSVDDSAADPSTDDSSTDGAAIDSAVTPEEQLNSIYTIVLENSALNYTKPERKKWYKLLRQTIGAIILLSSPLSAFSLASLLDVQGEGIIRTLDDLHSILDIPKPKDRFRPLRLHHPSFRDFLLNKERCGKHFYVDEMKAHRMLADNCIRLMSNSLKRDICQQEAPGILVADVENSRIEQYLPLEVRYACLYWIQHLQKSGTQLCDNDEVHQFLQVHLLHWLEALGWIGKTSEGILAVLSLEAQIQVSLLCRVLLQRDVN
jgi:hypothetical protein